MKNKGIIILLVISALIFGGSCIGLIQFEKYVNNSDGFYKQYKYTTGSIDDCMDIDVSMTDSWVKLLPEDFEPDSHFENNKFEERNEFDEGVFSGRTVDITVSNKSEYRINKWDIVYDVPCDMYFDKAWNGTVEIHQYNETNVDTIATKDLPGVDTCLNVVPLEELYLIPLKKGDRIIYHPADFECPIAESFADTDAPNNAKIGLIIYTEDDSFALDQMSVRYYIVQSLEDYPMYSALTFLVMLFGVVALASAIFLIVTIRYDRIHGHDMEIISQAIGTFSKFIDSKDKYTNNHSYRVAAYSKLVAKRLGLSEGECEDIYYIGLLHDTGKIIIDSKILNKPGRLTSQEFEIIKSHTTKGADILKDFTAIKDITVGALYHHERYDGKGYPSGIAGENIPLVARIICVCDAYDAMSSNRCYRAQLDNDQIIEQLVINKGKQFDPEIVDIFLECINNGETEAIRRSGIES